MKGTLFLLALLLTWDLQSKTTCSPFDKVFLFLAFGFEILVNDKLNKYEATDAEREAFAKLQECFRVAGVEGKILNVKFLSSIISSYECKRYYGQI